MNSTKVNTSDNHEAMDSKRLRVTMACERCRSKKVKCDFAHPQCTRCQKAKVSCCYTGNSSQINLFNLMQLNETVETLKKKIQSLESSLNQVSRKRKADPEVTGNLASATTPWTLSFTPKGLSIDTNIASLPDLYETLLSTLSEPVSPTSAATEHLPPLWKSHLKTLPLYSTWESKKSDIVPMAFTTDLFPEETLLYMISVFESCFLCLPSYHPRHSIAQRYISGVLDPLLANCVLAWTSRHTAIHHNLFPGSDPNQVGHSFYLKAKELIKDRFASTSEDTLYSLLILYIYTLGIPGVESEAYLYLGLAIRMCLDMKMNLESKSSDPYEKERNRRYFWVLYFLETLSAVHWDKAFTLPDTITVQFPTLMEHEMSGETRYRVEFIIQRFKITRVYHDIVQTTRDTSLQTIDRALQKWYDELPPFFKYERGDVQKRVWNTGSFREQACVKLNFEYNFHVCQVYSGSFLEAKESPMQALAHEMCLKAADNTVELLECWTLLQQPWCHFSFENIMLMVKIYGHVLDYEKSSDADLQNAQKKMEKIARILENSPISNHKYITMILQRINESLKKELVQTTHTQENLGYWPSLLDFGTALNSNIPEPQWTSSMLMDQFMPPP